MKDTQEALLIASEEDNSDEEEDELQAVAKHFGKDLDELTLEALRKLEMPLDASQDGTGEDELWNDGENHEDIPRRNAPSLETILGPIRSAATLGLNESISDCIKDERKKGE